MFISAIETATAFTRPIQTISRVWGSTTVLPGAATLFFVNAEGWALTCRHVANQLPFGDQLLQNFTNFKAERSQLPAGKKSRQLLRDLERRYGYSDGQPVEMYNTFINCFEGPLELELHMHTSLDLALLKFNRFTRLGANTFPTFARNGQDLKQGKFLCRLGFPFPEFANFEYDSAADRIRWTAAGRRDTPRFPIDGMVTRHLAGPAGVVGFELSTPGLKGQSGGPAFDANALIWGMQSATNHLDLDFDVDTEVLRNGQRHRVKDSAFLHVGHCIHVDVLKQFMRDNNVAFVEG
jgi:hypothetical protein